MHFGHMVGDDRPGAGHVVVDLMAELVQIFFELILSECLDIEPGEDKFAHGDEGAVPVGDTDGRFRFPDLTEGLAVFAPERGGGDDAGDDGDEGYRDARVHDYTLRQWYGDPSSMIWV